MSLIKTKNSKVNFEAVSFWIIAALVFLMPVFFLPVSVLGLPQAKLSLFAIGTLVAFIFFVIDKVKKGTLVISYGAISVSAGVLTVVYFVSTWLSISGYKSFIGSMVEQDTFVAIAVLFLFMTLVSILSKTHKRIFVILAAFFSSVFIVMVSQIVRIVIGHKIFGFSILDQPINTLVGSWGDLTMLSLFFLATLVIILETTKLKKVVNWLLGILMVVPFLFVIISGISFDFYFFGIGLGFIISILSVIIFAYLFSLRRVEKNSPDADGGVEKSKKKVSASLALLLISITFVLFGSQLNSYLYSVTGITYIEGRPNWQSTFSIGSQVLKERPFLGSGPNTFDIEWNLHHGKEVNNYIFWNNEYNFGIGFVPTSIVTVGIIGFVLWILFYSFVFIKSFKVLFAPKNKEGGSGMDVIVAVGAILTSLTLIFYSPGIVVVFANMMFIGLLSSLSLPPRKAKGINLHNKQWHNFVSTIVYIIVVVVSLYLIYMIAAKAVANTYYRNAVLGTNVDQSVASIGKAISIDSTQSLYYETAAQIYASKVSSYTGLTRSEAESKKDEINSNILNAINYSVLAEQVNPGDYKPKVLTGKILEFFGAIGLKDANQGAIQKYVLASKEIPSNPLPLLFASNVSLSINDREAAKDYLAKAIALKSDYSDVPELGKEIQNLVYELNKNTSKIVETATTTDEEESK